MFEVRSVILLFPLLFLEKGEGNVRKGDEWELVFDRHHVLWIDANSQ